MIWHKTFPEEGTGSFKMVRLFFAIFLFAALAGFAGFAAYGQTPKGFVAVDPPKPMPPFVFEDEKGRALDLKDFRGRYVLLNIWSTSCVPCESEMPTLNALSKQLDGSKIAVIALAEDHDGRAAARVFFKRHSIDHLSVYDDPSGRAPFILHTRGLPTTFFIDPQGAEIAQLEGAADWTQDAVIAFLKSHMAQ
jgi:thiol-disulfide isomerase/thioredoxin